MFRGNITATVDDKGRLKIPTAFKETLDQKYGEDLDFFVTSLDGTSVRIYPLPVWIKIEESMVLVRGEKEQNKIKRLFLERTNYWGQTARGDGQGRVLIPALLRERAGMQGEVAVMGRVEFLEVTSMERKREPMAQPISDEDRAGMDDLGID
jgi:MraZ protein